MDYSLAALKLLCSQLKHAREVPSQNSFTLGGILFQRAWLQGVLVSTGDGGDDGGPLLLDDGTGVIELSLAGEFRLRHWKVGMYVMVVGGYVVRTGEPPMIKWVFDLLLESGDHHSDMLTITDMLYNVLSQVHKIVDLSSSPDREAMWYLEVLEAYKLFYQPLVEEFT